MAENVQDTKKIIKMIQDGMSQAEVAKAMGVSKQAISQRLKRFKGYATRAVINDHVEAVVQDRLDTIGQLKKTNGYANELLDACMAWTRGDPGAIQVLENTARQIRVKAAKAAKGEDGEGDEDTGMHWITEWKIKDPREIALKAMAEIRNQLKLQFDIFTTIYSMKAAQHFQDAVIEVIKETDPDVADAIVRRLHSKQSVRRVIEQPGQGNGI